MLSQNKVLDVLKAYNIDYATRGKNISKKVICGIDCPFCGDDTGKHLGIFPNGFYVCWKNSEHKGNIFYLFSHLFGLSVEEVKLLFDDFYDIEFETEEIIKSANKKLELPKEFIKIDRNRPSTIMFYNYLLRRGFDNIETLCEKYHILCCITGEWTNRIIFPIFMNKRLVTWLGRDISNNSLRMRYKNLSSELSLVKTTDCLYNYDYLLQGGDILIITEGIFDALKIDFYTDKSVKATCVFTSRLSDNQIKLISKLDNKYNDIFIVFDRDAYGKALESKETLSFMKTRVHALVTTVKKDLGDFSQKEVLDFVKNLW